jgi:hypothetical protein
MATALTPAAGGITAISRPPEGQERTTDHPADQVESKLGCGRRADATLPCDLH